MAQSLVADAFSTIHRGVMGQSYDIQDEIAGQLAGLPAERVAADVMGALQGHEAEAEALRLLADRIQARLMQIEQKGDG